MASRTMVFQRGAARIDEDQLILRQAQSAQLVPERRQLVMTSVATLNDCQPRDKGLYPNFICGQLSAEELSIKFLEQKSKPI